MSEYIYFFDLNQILLDRYPAKISTLINENKSNNFKFLFLYTEIYGGENTQPLKLPEGSIRMKVICSSSRPENRLASLE